MARPPVCDCAAREAKRARRPSSSCFEKALRAARGRDREKKVGESLQREGAVAVVAWKPLPGGHGEAGAGGRRRGGLRVAHRGSRRRAGSATAN
jgi:hypothetical protein